MGNRYLFTGGEKVMEFKPMSKDKSIHSPMYYQITLSLGEIMPTPNGDITTSAIWNTPEPEPEKKDEEKKEEE